jgi:hypothetical protein
MAVSYNGVVTTDGARGRGERVGGTEEDTAGLDSVTTLPDHGADGAATHVCILSAAFPAFRCNKWTSTYR